MPDSKTKDDARLDDLLSELQEMNTWLRVMALPTLKASLLEVLKKPEARRVYQASDGRQIREVLPLLALVLEPCSPYGRAGQRQGWLRQHPLRGAMSV